MIASHPWFFGRHTARRFIALVLSLQRLEHRLLSVDVIWGWKCLPHYIVESTKPANCLGVIISLLGSRDIRASCIDNFDMFTGQADDRKRRLLVLEVM